MEPALFARYVSTAMPQWLSADERAYRRAAAGKRRQLRGWLPASKDARICDVGCGPGALLFMFREMGYSNLAGVDISPQCVELARKVCPGVELGDATEFLSRHKGEFDLVCMMDVIEHHPKERLLPLLEAARDSLRPGGSLILQTPNCAGPFGARHRYWDITHEIGLTTHAVQQMARAVGFRDLEFRECVDRPHGLKSLVRWLLWKVLRRLVWLWMLVETGDSGGGVYSQVMLARATTEEKPLA